MAFDPNAFNSNQFQTPIPAPPPIPPEPVPATSIAISGASRSGLFRSDAWPIEQWLLVKIGDSLAPHFFWNGEDLDRSGIARDTIAITDNQNSSTDTCSFLMFGEPPLSGKPIIIAAGTFAKRLFGGAIHNLTQLPMKPGNPEMWQVDCTDWWYFANRRRVYAKYLTFPADVIFKDLVSRFTSGFTYVNVQAAPNVTGGIEFDGDDFMKAISKLCARVGYDCYIDEHKDFHFFEIETIKARALEPRRYHYWDLSFTENVSQLRNRVYQQAGGGMTTAQVLAGAVSIPIDVVSWYPTTGPNMRVQHGGQIIPYTAIVGNSLTVPAGAITHVIPQGEEISLFVQVDDLESQARVAAVEGEGSDGIHEFTATPDRRMKEDEAINKATAEMEAYNRAALSGSYKAYDDLARSGRMVEINLPYRGKPLRGQRFGITSVTTRVKAPKRYFEKSIAFGTTEKLDLYTALRKVQ